MIIHYSMAVKGRMDSRPPPLEQQLESKSNNNSNRPDPIQYGKLILATRSTRIDCNSSIVDMISILNWLDQFVYMIALLVVVLTSPFFAIAMLESHYLVVAYDVDFTHDNITR